MDNSKKYSLKKSFTKTLRILSNPGHASKDLSLRSPQRTPDTTSSSHSLRSLRSMGPPETPVDYFFSYSFDEATANQVEPFASTPSAPPSIRSRTSSIVGLTPKRMPSSATLNDYNGQGFTAAISNISASGLGPGGMTPVSEYTPEFSHRSKESASSGLCFDAHGPVTAIAEEHDSNSEFKASDEMLESADEIARHILQEVAGSRSSWAI